MSTADPIKFYNEIDYGDKLKISNERSYIGHFKSGKYHGKGTFIFGKIQIGSY